MAASNEPNPSCSPPAAAPAPAPARAIGRDLRAGATQQPLLSVVSYNILSFPAGPLSEAEAIRRYGRYCPDELAWPARWRRLHQEVEEFEADLICLQEVTDEGYEADIGPFMTALGYDHALQTDTNKQPGHNMSTATFWRRRRWRLAGEPSHRSRGMVLWLEPLSTEADSDDGAAPAAAAAARSSSNSSARSGPGPARLMAVVNVHLEGAPYRPAARVSQMRKMLKVVAGRRAETDTVVVAGDFNAGTDSCVAQLLATRFLEAGSRENGVAATERDLTHELQLASAYEGVGEAAQPSYISTFFSGRVDHIFVSANLRLLRTMPTRGEGRQARMVADIGLPNKLCPSDHLPVGAQFELRAEDEATGGSHEAFAPLSPELTPTKEMMECWLGIQATAPPKPKGRPDPELLVRLREHAALKKEFLASIPQKLRPFFK